MLRTQFKMEMIVYTQDSTYSHSLCERKREEEDDQPLPTHKIRSTIFSTDNHATLQEMMLHLKSYYKVSIV
jgi:interferon-induced GTP-binding protein Mx1